MTDEIRIEQCTCGHYPKIEKEVHFYGGGRYKGQTRSESWIARCRGENCCQMAYKRRGVFETKEEAVGAWNDAITSAKARQDAPDTLIFDLENSRDDVKRALARLLRAAKEAQVEQVQGATK